MTAPADAMDATDATLLMPITISITVRRKDDSPKGSIGFGLSNENRVIDILAGSQTEKDGLLELGDLVIAVDDVDLDGKPLRHVINPNAVRYEFIVMRVDTSLAATINRQPHQSAVRNSSVLRLTNARMERGAKGFGIDVTNTGLVQNIAPGGSAERSGNLFVDDVVVKVAGIKLNNRRIVEVMDRSAAVQMFTVMRAEQEEPAEEQEAVNTKEAPWKENCGAQKLAVSGHNGADMAENGGKRTPLDVDIILEKSRIKPPPPPADSGGFFSWAFGLTPEPKPKPEPEPTEEEPLLVLRGAEFAVSEGLLGDAETPGRVSKPIPIRRAADKAFMSIRKLRCDSEAAAAAAQRELNAWRSLSGTAERRRISAYGTHVLAFHGEGRVGQQLFLLFEDCGSTLADLVALRQQSKRPLPRGNELGDLMGDACAALAHLHAQTPPMVHCNLRMESLARAEGVWKLCECANVASADGALRRSVSH
tara:strand:- start:155 stop:1588 length:1434 start_codon:yes stop_codon:yes gene_type:complete